MKLQLVKTEWGVSGVGGREKESDRLVEWEMERWTEMVMVWVRNGRLWKRTPEYFQQSKSIESVGCQLRDINFGWISNSSV